MPTLTPTRRAVHDETGLLRHRVLWVENDSLRVTRPVALSTAIAAAERLVTNGHVPRVQRQTDTGRWLTINRTFV